MVKRKLFLGLDLSTQSLIALVIDRSGDYLERFSINFDAKYPSYQTEGGVLLGENPTVVHGENGIIEVYKACERFALGSGDDPANKIERFKKKYVS